MTALVVPPEPSLVDLLALAEEDAAIPLWVALTWRRKTRTEGRRVLFHRSSLGIWTNREEVVFGFAQRRRINGFIVYANPTRGTDFLFGPFSPSRTIRLLSGDFARFKSGCLNIPERLMP
jgi:hypothetical protein